MNEETKLTNLTERHQNDFTRKDTSLHCKKDETEMSWGEVLEARYSRLETK